MTSCKEQLVAYFEAQGVPFEALDFPETYTAQEVAGKLHVSGWQFAKVVMGKAEDRLVMLVLPSPLRVDFQRLAEVLETEVELAREDEFAGRFPGCVPGAMPPFGSLYDVPTYVDQSMAEAEDMVFLTGTHHEAMKLRYADYERLAHPQMLHFAR
jgi:Ala-tRNA(Pro) deacylase